MLVEPPLGFRNAADARRKSGPVFAGDAGRAGWARRELRGVDVAPASDAVDVLALGLLDPARAFAFELFALTFGKTLR